ncbi:hypothetical protein SDC9_117501 [bioreactor metagenome]|uniref:Uncharacterized protein n=1 Tax=bioreactor metagenome TaxID=1076179 RepID=A0A645BYE0_9ZZZZ
MRSFCFCLLHKPTHVFAIGVNSFFGTCFFNGYWKTVFADTGNGGTCTSAVIRTVVIMSQLNDYPIARTNTFKYIGPKTSIKGAATSSSQSMILDGYLICIKKVAGIVAPAPLSVITVT